MNKPRSAAAKAGLCFRPSHRAVLTARLALGLALAMALPGGAQNGGTVPRMPQPLGQRIGGDLDDSAINDQVEQERRLRALNADRQKSMVSDANKLLQLANELNTEVAGAGADPLTSEQLRKLNQIEKLAHSVKEKMSTSVRGTPSYHPPTSPVMRSIP